MNAHHKRVKPALRRRFISVALSLGVCAALP
ncbi:MAG: hypothetical protein QOJ04_4931, partial [Caballeronia sp.]|nr:hypothetical protein [Caballeronia sp.]